MRIGDDELIREVGFRVKLLEVGLLPFREVIAWVDKQIENLNFTPYWLIEMSMAANAQEVLRVFREVDWRISKEQESELWRLYADKLLRILNDDPSMDSRIAEILYNIGLDSATSCLGSTGELLSFWDSIDLAKDGVFGDQEEERGRLRIFLEDRSRKRTS